MSAFPSKPLHCVHMKKKKNRQGAAKAGSQPASAKVFMLCWLCAAEQISALANAAGVCSALEGEQCGSRHSVQANTEALTWDLKCLTCVISGRFFWVWCMHVARSFYRDASTGHQKQVRVKLKPKLPSLGRSTIQVDLALAGAQKTTQYVLSIQNFHVFVGMTAGEVPLKTRTGEKKHLWSSAT